MSQEWISQHLKNTGRTQAELAHALGMPAARVSEILKGKRQIKVEEAAGLGAFFELPVNDVVLRILGREKEAAINRDSRNVALASGLIEIDRTEFAVVDRYDAALSAGDGCLVDPNAGPIGHQLIEHQWLRMVTNAAPQNLAVVRVDGDSMEPTLNDGDWVLLDRTQTRIAREGIYALAVFDSCWIKRISLNLKERLIRIISDNDRYPAQELAEDEVTVIGRMVAMIWRKG